MTDLQTSTVYLPFVASQAPPAYGVQVDGPLTIPVTQNRIYQMPARWMGLDPWLPDIASAVDPNPLIIGTKTCPPEYRVYADYMGSPPKPEYYCKYVEFICDLVERYHPLGIEVWNEPDVPLFTMPAEQQSYYGAWVVDEDYYAAGRAYGELLSLVYDALQGTGVLVLGGALQNGAVVQGREFLRGMLETGQCDYVSFHVYPFYGDDYKQIVQDSFGSIHSMTDKPLFVTETSLLTRGKDTFEFQNAQVDYFNWMKECMAWGGTPWLYYAADNDWFHCGLYRDGEPMPVWEAWAC